MRNLIVAALLESHQRIVKIDQALFREVSIKCRADIVGIQRHPLAAAVVVHNDLNEIGIIRELTQVLFRTVDRIEGSVVPYVPTHWDRGFRRLYRFVECSVGLAKTVSEEHFPSGQFWIPQQDPPELNVVTVRGTFATPCRANEFLQLQKPLFGALHIHAALFRFALTKLAEASHVARIDRRNVMGGSQAVRKRTLALGSPHNSVDVIGTGIVLDQAGKEIPVVWIVDAQRFGVAPVEVSLLDFLDVRQVGAKHVLKPADDLQATLLSGRDYFGQDVQIAVVRSACVLDDRVLVVLRMRCGEVAAVKIEVVFLLAVIGQRLARNLSSGDTSTVGEYRKKQRIDAGAFLKHIEDFLSTFIHKRNCSHLDADHFGGHSSMSQSRHSQCGARSSGDLHEFTAIHVESQHEHSYCLWLQPTSKFGPECSPRLTRSGEKVRYSSSVPEILLKIPARLHQRLLRVVIVAQC